MILLLTLSELEGLSQGQTEFNQFCPINLIGGLSNDLHFNTILEINNIGHINFNRTNNIRFNDLEN